MTATSTSGMTRLVVRRLLIDLATPLPRHWCGGDAFRTAFFNALSMSFPFGEQFFIDSVRAGLAALPADRRDEREAEIRAFIGQEATHRRIHTLFNEHLQNQGLVDRWTPRALARSKILQGQDPRHALAITAATEHFTAILADWLLRNPDAMADTEPRLRMMWQWHSAEESEHRTTAFDLYLALGGNSRWRRTWFWRISWFFATDLARQTLDNLSRDGQLWKWRTWTSAAAFLFGSRGLVWQTFRPWRNYLRTDFHPAKQDDRLAREWLAANADQYLVVGDAA